MSRKLSLLVALVCSVTLIVLLVTASADAAPTISITVGPDPVESITTQLGVNGTDEGESRAYLKVKPAGGRGCAANAEADEGSWVTGEFPPYLQDAGSFGETENWTFRTAGSYLLCAWLEHNTNPGSAVVASASLTISVRQPHLTLSIQAPSTVDVGQAFQIAMTMQAETEREAYEFLVPNTGRGCPANAGAAGSTAGELGIRPFGVAVDGGPSTFTENEKFSTVGSYLVCGYVEYPESSSVPEATANASVMVVEPPPPCVVPKLGAHQGLTSVEHRIRAAHCTVGKIHYTHSTRHKRGLVLALSPKPGAVLASHAVVAVDVSSGPPPRPKRRRRH